MNEDVSRRKFMGMAGVAMALTAGSAAVAQEAPPAAAKKKILGICCSYRKGRTTAESMRICLEEAAKVSDRIETEMIELAGLKIPGQVVVGLPLEEGERDDFPALAPKISDPNVAGIIIGTPIYFGNMTSLCKVFLERWVAFREDFSLSGKLGAVLTVGSSRNGGQELTLQTVQAVLMAQEMLVIGEGRPTAHWGATLWNRDNTVAGDDIGLTTARNLGKRMAEIIIKGS